MSVVKDTAKFYKNFSGEKGVIGYSFFNRPIYYFAVKKTEKPKIVIQYAIHAREYVTSYLAFKMITDYSNRGKSGTIYFIPLVNPDGAEICETTKPLYKANARGVDLNVNFNARWGKGAKNTLISGDENFIGEYPFSEPETKALRDFTLCIKPNITISYHTKGEETYWDFFQTGKRRQRDYSIAKKLAKATSYPLKSAGISCGGYKDWCIEKLKITAFTVETGSDFLTHPIKKEVADELFMKNKNAINAVIEGYWEAEKK